MEVKSGAAVIPFAIKDGSTWFLFHKTFSGRRAGLLVDFGGGGRAGESHMQTAAREFVEETDAMFFADIISQDLAVLVPSQAELLLERIEQTLLEHPDWWCARQGKAGDRPRDWRTFFVELEYRDLAKINNAWAEDTVGRFRKQRELLWLTSAQLLDIIDNNPEALWKRLRQYRGLRVTVQAIAQATDPTQT